MTDIRRKNSLFIQGPLILNDSPDAELTAGEWIDILLDEKDNLVAEQVFKAAELLSKLTQKLSTELAA